ncbi:MAG: LptF/LptG family permease [Kiritimatiellae bacterium]|nr:LptF/LptG family permease [Kiritimatiellia bacterium]
MRIVTRYLLREFLGPLAACFVSFNAIFVLFDLFGHLSRFLDADLPLRLVLRYYAGVVSLYSAWFIPASCMLATLYTMWRLSHHSEITAMRASGISFHRLTLPFFAVALAMAALAFANSQWIAPDAAEWSDRLKESSFVPAAAAESKNHLFMNPRARRTWVFGSVDADSPEGFANATNFVRVTHDTAGVNDWGVRADGARWLDGTWWLANPQIVSFDIDGEELPAAAAPPPRLPQDVAFPEFEETPRDMFLATRSWDHLGATDMLRRISLQGRDDPEKRFDFWYRLAAPWACLVITLFSIPAGITTGRQSVFKGLVLALGSFFGFYALTLLLEFLGQHGYLPALPAAMLPNLVFLALGLFMYGRLT